MLSSSMTLPASSSPASSAPGTPTSTADSDTELADRLLEGRLKARLFGATPVPVTIGPYRLDGQLGAGGMGVVYRAHDPELGRDIALKVMHPDLGEAAERIRREARALARLAHPNIVTVFDTGDHDGRLYVAMELVEGSTLRAWSERLDAAPRTRRPGSRSSRRGSLRMILEYFLQAAHGLRAAHAAGLVHCDFKPENVLIGTNGRVRVVDFGIANLAGAPVDEIESTGQLVATTRTSSGEIVGTPAYMAPEQFQGGPIDARADQFAFCVALQEALTGARPFAGETLVKLMDAVLTGEPAALPRWVPGSLRSMIGRGLSREPARRFPSMDPIIRVMERLLAPRTWRTVALAMSVACAAALTLFMLRERAEAPVPSSASLDLWTWGRQQIPTLCITAPDVPAAEADYIAESSRLAAGTAAAIAGSPEYFDAKARLLALQLARGDLAACKTVAMTRRAAPEMPWRSAAEFRCLWARFCEAPADATCPPGLVAEGVGGCRPVARCGARGLPAQTRACLSGQGECCRGALALTRYSWQKTGALDAAESRREQRELAEAGCNFGHAELCLDAADVGGDAPLLRRRACQLGNQLACHDVARP